MLNSRWPIMKFSTNDIGAFAMANTGVSLQNGMSWLYVVLEAAKWTIQPSSKRKRYLQEISQPLKEFDNLLASEKLCQLNF